MMNSSDWTIDRLKEQFESSEQLSSRRTRSPQRSTPHHYLWSHPYCFQRFDRFFALLHDVISDFIQNDMYKAAIKVYNALLAATLMDEAERFSTIILKFFLAAKEQLIQKLNHSKFYVRNFRESEAWQNRRTGLAAHLDGLDKVKDFLMEECRPESQQRKRRRTINLKKEDEGEAEEDL